MKGGIAVHAGGAAGRWAPAHALNAGITQTGTQGGASKTQPPHASLRCTICKRTLSITCSACTGCV